MTIYLHTMSPGVRGGRPVLHGVNPGRDLVDRVALAVKVHQRILAANHRPTEHIEVLLLDSKRRPIAQLEQSEPTGRGEVP